MPRSHRDTHDPVRRAVHKPGDPRPACAAIRINRDRRLDVIGLPHLIPPSPRPRQEHVMSPRRPLPSRETSPLPRQQITPDSAMQRRDRRRRVTLAPGRASGQLTVNGRHVPLQQPEQSQNLRGDREPVTGLRPLARTFSRTLVALGSGQPPPHRPLLHLKGLRHQPHMPGRERPVPPQREQPAHSRPAKNHSRDRRQPRGLPQHPIFGLHPSIRPRPPASPP